MRKFPPIIFITMALAMTTGCASTGGYFLDRGRDAADILTLNASAGVAARVRAGPVHVGVLLAEAPGGLRGGEWSYAVHESAQVELLCVPFPFSRGHRSVFSGEAYTPSYIGFSRGKDYCAVSHIPFITTDIEPLRSDADHSRWRTALLYLGQIEVAVGCLANIHIGVNTAEAIDFILGWTTIDIFSDDLERRKSNQAVEATSQ